MEPAKQARLFIQLLSTLEPFEPPRALAENFIAIG